MKYKVGDTPKVREDLNLDDLYGNMDVIPCMIEFAGKNVTISEVDEKGNYYHIKEDEYPYSCCWTDEMFEDVPMSLNKLGEELESLFKRVGLESLTPMSIDAFMGFINGKFEITNYNFKFIKKGD